MAAILPGAPQGSYPHRKAWEFALGVAALKVGGVLTRDAIGLSTGAGHEAILYWLTTQVRWLFATDIYGFGDFSGGESSAQMLVDPDLFAPYDYERRRLTVCHMNALDLRFEDGLFDFSISFGSIEHFGGEDQARIALAEMARVVRPGGVIFFTTEIVADGGPRASLPGLELFTADRLRALVSAEPTVDWLDGEALDVPPSPDPVVDLITEIDRIEAGAQTYPHRRIGVNDPSTGYRAFTSVSIALRRREDYP